MVGRLLISFECRLLTHAILHDTEAGKTSGLADNSGNNLGAMQTELLHAALLACASLCTQAWPGKGKTVAFYLDDLRPLIDQLHAEGQHVANSRVIARASSEWKVRGVVGPRHGKVRCSVVDQ